MLAHLTHEHIRLEDINNFGTYTLKPDITFFIDLPTEKANERMSVSRDRIESEGSNFQERVRDQYLALNAKEPNRVILINGDQSIDKVFEDIWTTVQEKFGL